MSTTRSGQSNLLVPGHAPLTPKSGSESSLHRVKNLPGYTTPVFKGKEEQRALVEAEVGAKVREQDVSGFPTRSSLNVPYSGLHPASTHRQRGQLVLLKPRYRRYLLPERVS